MSSHTKWKEKKRKTRLITLKTSSQNDDVIVHYVMRTKMSASKILLRRYTHTHNTQRNFVEKDSTNETNYNLWIELILNKKKKKKKREYSRDSSTLQFHVQEVRTHTHISFRFKCLHNYQLPFKKASHHLNSRWERMIFIEIGRRKVKVMWKWMKPFSQKSK